MPGREETHWQLADVHEIVRKETGKNLTSAGLSDFWYRKGFEFWKQEPAQAAKLLLKKTCLFFTRFEISNNEDIYAAWEGSKLIRMLPVGFWLAGPLGLMGLVFSFVNRRGRLLSLFSLVYSFSVILFFVNARFRLPVLPFLTLLGAYAAFEFWRKFREKRKLLPHLLILTAFASLVNSNFYRLQKRPGPHRFFQLGNVFLEQNNLDEAEKNYRQALQADPDFRFVHLNLGAIALKRGDLKTAEAEFRAELETDPSSERAFANLSLVSRLSEKHREALFWAEKAVQSKPYFQEGYLNRALAHRELGKPDSALEALVDGRKNCARFVLGDFLAASIRIEQRRFETAQRELNAVLDTLSHWQPTYDPQPFFVSTRQFGENISDLKSRVHYLLGRIAGEQKNLPDAIQNFRRSLAENPANADAAADMGTALDLSGRPEEALAYFEKALAARPASVLLLYNYGLALAKTGRLSAARDAFQKSLAADPSFLPAKEKLALTESLLKKSGQ
jgi:tetratricopeptide (TPR) repeat protein